ncbi:hypothetical protein ABZ848_15735 [Streptomyces sp. NPDC047081]
MTHAPATSVPQQEPDGPDLSAGWGEQRTLLRKDLRRRTCSMARSS